MNTCGDTLIRFSLKEQSDAGEMSDDALFRKISFESIALMVLQKTQALYSHKCTQ